MKIILNKLLITHFKGIKALEVDFSHNTNILSDNATGKTSVMDAFLWPLFGKDSTDRTAFEVKHISANGNGSPKDVEVEGELRTVDKLTGEIDFTGKKQSDVVVGYFAHIEMVNGFAKTLFMTKDATINHAKKYSKSYGYSSSAWQTEFDAMAKKTVIRNLLSHYGYLSVEMVGAIDEDIRADTQYRDQDVREHTGKKTFDIEKVEFEEVQGDNGSEDDSDQYNEEP